MPYIYSFWQTFQALRLFRTLEYLLKLLIYQLYVFENPTKISIVNQNQNLHYIHSDHRLAFFSGQRIHFLNIVAS